MHSFLDSPGFLPINAANRRRKKVINAEREKERERERERERNRQTDRQRRRQSEKTEREYLFFHCST